MRNLSMSYLNLNKEWLGKFENLCGEYQENSEDVRFIEANEDEEDGRGTKAKGVIGLVNRGLYKFK